MTFRLKPRIRPDRSAEDEADAESRSDLSLPKPGRRLRFTAEQRQAFLEEAARRGQAISETTRRYGISPSLLF